MPTAAMFALLFAPPILLPGGPPVSMDYLAWDSESHRVWVPAGNTGRVDVVDIGSGAVTAVTGFPTVTSPRPGRPDLGPSSVAVGAGRAWVGNRANSQVCAIDAHTLEKQACIQLASVPDGVCYVAPTHELWITTPRDHSITIVDVGGKTPGAPVSIKLPGSPEGFALDAKRGLFFTNLEDKDQTLAIDLKTRKVAATWSPGCGAEGPRGLEIDTRSGFLFVACTDGVVALKDGAVVGRLKTGAGVDNIGFDRHQPTLFVASGKDGMLTRARVDESGALIKLDKVDIPTAPGARTVVVDDRGAAYIADSLGGRLLVVKPIDHSL